MFPRADKAAFIQNDNGLMDQPGKIDGIFVFQRLFQAFSSGAISFTRLLNRSRISSGAFQSSPPALHHASASG
jgi:hypothetical protein